MKYIFFSFLVLVFVYVSVPLSVSALDSVVDPQGAVETCAILKSVNLRYKAKDEYTNNEVSVLQKFLHDHGYLIPKPTGYFGAGTLRAVIKFQKNNKISGTGYVGTLTRAMIKKIDCESALLPSAPTFESIPASTTLNTQTPLPQSSQTIVEKVLTVPPPITIVPLSNPSSAPITEDCKSGGATSIKVVSPNGGETYVAGQQFLIKWAGCNMQDAENSAVGVFFRNVNNLEEYAILSPTTVANTPLLRYTQNDGEEIFSLPIVGDSYVTRDFAYTSGKNFIIEIVLAKKLIDGAWGSGIDPIKDISDTTFAVTY